MQASIERLAPSITDAGVDEQLERVDVPFRVLRRFAKTAGRSSVGHGPMILHFGNVSRSFALPASVPRVLLSIFGQ